MLLALATGPNESQIQVLNIFLMHWVFHAMQLKVMIFIELLVIREVVEELILISVVEICK